MASIQRKTFTASAPLLQLVWPQMLANDLRWGKWYNLSKWCNELPSIKILLWPPTLQPISGSHLQPSSLMERRPSSLPVLTPALVPWTPITSLGQLYFPKIFMKGDDCISVFFFSVSCLFGQDDCQQSFLITRWRVSSSGFWFCSSRGGWEG